MANVSLRWLSIVLYKTSLGQPSEMEETKSFRMLLRDYHSLVKLYSCENPTHSSDKLPAFPGIVMRLSPCTGSYFARNLEYRSPGWSAMEARVRPMHPLKTYHAPTWSSAVTDGSILYDNKDGLKPSSQSLVLVDHLVTPRE